MFLWHTSRRNDYIAAYASHIMQSRTENKNEQPNNTKKQKKKKNEKNTKKML